MTIRDRLARGISFEATAALRVLDKDVQRPGRRYEGSRAGRRTAAIEKHPSGEA